MTDETATYEAEFLCGHQRTYPLPDGLDPGFLAGIAAMRVCSDCAYRAFVASPAPTWNELVAGNNTP